jgi:hypothetical protein
MKKLISIFSLSIIISFAGYSQAAGTGRGSTTTATTPTTKTSTTSTTSTGSNKTMQNPLSNEEVVKGLKDALSIGIDRSTSIASKLDGFYKNPALFIPFPPEAKLVKDYANRVGMTAQVQKFEMTLNRAAEEAAKSAAPIFLNAIKSMNITDGFNILKGATDAATQYLKLKTTAELKLKFTPIVQSAINKVELTKYWNPIVTKYNKIPLVKKQNPDLTAYVTERALAGLFKLLADEEAKIRKDPMAQVTSTLQSVFGSLLH